MEKHKTDSLLEHVCRLSGKWKGDNVGDGAWAITNACVKLNYDCLANGCALCSGFFFSISLTSLLLFLSEWENVNRSGVNSLI